MEEREEYIYNYLQDLLPKYKSIADSYLLFNEPLFYRKYSVPYGAKLTPEFLATQIENYEVDDSNYRFIQNGQTRQISSLRYYPLTDDNIVTVLKSINYDFD